ncbi:MAG: serine/threonine protein kinase [Prochlorotrichaceae cyanobacterium]|jgi:serine/threonine-protein kinase
MPDSLILQPGMSLGNGRYVLDRLVKQGRSSLTLQGIQVSSGKSLLFKFPLQDQGLLSAHRQRFQYIWQRIGHFQHPYLAQTIDYLEEKGVPCLVMEQISGLSLAQQIKTQGALAEAAALRFIFQIAQGVQQLHDRGLIHGNIKPHNLIQHHHSKAIVLVDWGLFWQGWNSQPLSSYSAPEPFMPPELRASLEVYSLASCLYTLVTGHPPISAAQRLTTPLVPPQVLKPDLTSMTQDAILQGMDLNPDRRPNSVQAWLTLLPQPYSPAQLPNLQAAAAGSVPHTPPPARNEVMPEDPGVKTAQTRVAIRPPVQVKPAPASSPPPLSRSSSGAFRPLLRGLWVMAIAMGVGFTAGGFLRWQRTQNTFAQSFFQKDQSFPPQAWPGTLELEFPEDAPLPEADYAGDSYDPYPHYDSGYGDPVAPVFPQEDIIAPEPVFIAPEPAQTEESAESEFTPDPFEPLPNVNADSFDDPFYGEPEVVEPPYSVPGAMNSDPLYLETPVDPVDSFPVDRPDN